MADEIMVMYAGRAVEHGPAQDVLTSPGHPYTKGLIATIPDPGRRQAVLPVIAGNVPDLRFRAPGCAFSPRCRMVIAECSAAVPALRAMADGHGVACVRASA